MTKHESEVMAFFLRQLGQLQRPNKNPEPDNLIRESLMCQPCAHYKLMQIGWRLEEALAQARSQIVQLQYALAQQANPDEHTDSYLTFVSCEQAPVNSHR